MATLTVFTPSYNRAHTLGRTYESLKKQSCRDFIWLIVDDGSTDGTAELVRQWQQDPCGFEIRYIYKENGGMHTAHNTAYENIDTELNVCIDSDDCMAEDAVLVILQKWSEVRDFGYAGLIGLDADLSGNLIGSAFPADMHDTTLGNFYATGGTGDKKLVYRTDVVKQYPPYPVFEGEKYVGLGYKYQLIDLDYKLATLNSVLCNVEYQIDGSSKNMFRQYRQNPRGFAFIRKVSMQHPISNKRLFQESIHYISCSIFSHNTHFFHESPRKLVTLLAIPFGIVLNCYIRYQTRNIFKG